MHGSSHFGQVVDARFMMYVLEGSFVLMICMMCSLSALPRAGGPYNLHDPGHVSFLGLDLYPTGPA